MKAIILILMERQRQRANLGYNNEWDLHKEYHMNKQLLLAAEAYEKQDKTLWPWSDKYWKPGPGIKNFIKAGALYLAHYEITGSLEALDSVERCAKKIKEIRNLKQ